MGAAEELLNGRGEATMGARSDFAQATQLATEMVTSGGLSEAFGPRSLSAGIEPSEDMRRQIDAEVNKLLRNALDAARDALARNKMLHEVITKALLERETLDGESFRQIVERHKVQPTPLRS